MTALLTARLAIVLAAAIAFGYGIRSDNNAMRWVGIGLLVAALAMRFIRPRERQ